MYPSLGCTEDGVYLGCTHDWGCTKGWAIPGTKVYPVLGVHVALWSTSRAGMFPGLGVSGIRGVVGLGCIHGWGVPRLGLYGG